MNRISLCKVWIFQDVVKADAGHVGVEKYISEVFDSWASFRPQYMIGSGNNKDCEEWFFDRKCIEQLESSSLDSCFTFHISSLLSMLLLSPFNYTALLGPRMLIDLV